MIKKIIGGLFVIAGIGALIGAGREQPDIITAIIGLGLGGYLLYHSSKAKPVKESSSSFPSEPTIQPIKTFSFQAAGFRFDCRFPNKHFRDRQSVLARSRAGDTLELRQYKWEGKPAFALISCRHGADVGVVPANHVQTVSELLENYTVTGKIVSLNEIEYQKEYYIKCDIQLSCFEK